MILCPECNGKSHVSDSRKVGDTVRRRRTCKKKHRWTTYETLLKPGTVDFEKAVKTTCTKVIMAALTTALRAEMKKI